MENDAALLDPEVDPPAAPEVPQVLAAVDVPQVVAAVDIPQVVAAVDVPQVIAALVPGVPQVVQTQTPPLAAGRRRRGPDINRRLRPTYSQARKLQAVQMLNQGWTSRRVARWLGPNCSCATPIRWRQQMRATAALRARLHQQIQNVANPIQ